MTAASAHGAPLESAERDDLLSCSMVGCCGPDGSLLSCCCLLYIVRSICNHWESCGLAALRTMCPFHYSNVLDISNPSATYAIHQLPVTNHPFMLGHSIRTVQTSCEATNSPLATSPYAQFSSWPVLLLKPLTQRLLWHCQQLSLLLAAVLHQLLLWLHQTGVLVVPLHAAQLLCH